ncbi:hypothetical protein PMAC_002846 [Pneumocystis sp. 'macacae']|nr:hypothetical protein PMAC_002846 [Pneumocystis sp. 'macacae']
MNMRRLSRSAARIALPGFDEAALLECICRLLVLDAHWIPAETGYSLYIRPTLIATEKTLHLHAPESASLFVIASPVGSFYGPGSAPVSLYAVSAQVRAWPGGVGDVKVGGNYTVGISAQQDAQRRGYDQAGLFYFGRLLRRAGAVAVWGRQTDHRGGGDELLCVLVDAGGQEAACYAGTRRDDSSGGDPRLGACSCAGAAGQPWLGGG